MRCSRTCSRSNVGWSRASSSGPAAIATFYSNHLDQAREQLARTPGPLPRLEILRKAPSIDSYDYEDFAIYGYEAQSHIKAAVAV